MDGSYLLQMNLRFGRGSTSAGAAHGLGEGHGESGRGHEPNGESHGTPFLAPPPPPPPPMTHADMMVELLATRHESARAMEIMAQAVVGLARGGHEGNGGNGGGARHPEGPSSYQDFLKTHPPTFTLSDEPLDAEHWLHILKQKFLLLDVANEQRVRFAVQQLLGSTSAWWDTFHAMEQPDHLAIWLEFTTAFREFFIPAGVINRKVTEFLELR